MLLLIILGLVLVVIIIIIICGGLMGVYYGYGDGDVCVVVIECDFFVIINNVVVVRF